MKWLIVFALLTSPISFADHHGGAGGGGGACKADAEKFCKDVQPGGGRVMKCLKEHDAELSAECKASQAQTKDKLKNFSEACQEDIGKLCKGVRRGGGRIIKCLKSHEAELSESCKSQMSPQ